MHILLHFITSSTLISFALETLTETREEITNQL
uniref:Uncharacterized protein n=1 Tax=Arundo donax TaxID=35708 RepID=A0A0A8ZWX3_ARUDO